MTFWGLLLCALLILVNIFNGSCNECMHCIAQGDERACDDAGETLLCNEELAERYLSIFTRINSQLDVEKADKSQFKCFKFIISGQEEYHLKGCTYKNLKICEHMQEGMFCKTCETDDCNGMYHEDYYDDDSGMAGLRESSFSLISICVLFVSLLYSAVNY